jgi:hypothetical protein
MSKQTKIETPDFIPQCLRDLYRAVVSEATSRGELNRFSVFKLGDLTRAIYRFATSGNTESGDAVLSLASGFHLDDGAVIRLIERARKIPEDALEAEHRATDKRLGVEAEEFLRANGLWSAK